MLGKPIGCSWKSAGFGYGCHEASTQQERNIFEGGKYSLQLPMFADLECLSSLECTHIPSSTAVPEECRQFIMKALEKTSGENGKVNMKKIRKEAESLSGESCRSCLCRPGLTSWDGPQERQFIVQSGKRRIGKRSGKANHIISIFIHLNLI